jgi:sugar/nucleoside kinase (ribokinase family)
VLAAVGELVEDIVVRVDEPVNLGSDTASLITRRRGGSAANVCAAAGWAGIPARFIGQVGDDAAGGLLVGALRDLGVDIVARQAGRTGTIVVFVDRTGERTMFPDPAASHLLDRPERAWLAGVDVLHVPLYSLIAEPLASTATTLIRWAHEDGTAVSIDASSAGVLQRVGVQVMVSRLAALAPDVLLANGDEAACLGADGLRAIGAAVTVIKHGVAPAEVRHGGEHTLVPAEDIGPVADTTGAGDAFAAAMLGGWSAGADPVDAVRAGHALAARVLTAADRP